jgi:pyruvate ferredoxin oxidoreductase alpha subunit
MAVRDVGWIQIFVENAQQAFDNIICAFKMAENKDVLIPIMVHLDGFHLSHVVEPLFLLEQEQISSFLPPYEYPLALNPEKPVSMGAFAMPYVFTETKKAQDVALKESKKVILDVWSEFGNLFDRHYKPIETYEAEDADTLLIMMGSFSETAMLAVDELRKEGRKVGLVRFRLWRPFPVEELLQATRKAKTIVVFDRSLSYGTYVGSVCSEVRAALYTQENRPKVVGFSGGLGGRDVAIAQFIDMINKGEKADKQATDEIEIIGVRE